MKGLFLYRLKSSTKPLREMEMEMSYITKHFINEFKGELIENKLLNYQSADDAFDSNRDHDERQSSVKVHIQNHVKINLQTKLESEEDPFSYAKFFEDMSV